MDMQKWVYHERQSGSMCAVHCLNSLFQGPVFDEVALAEIARELDMKEASLYQEAFGEVVEIKGSVNVSVDGNFSIQVIVKAIEGRGLKVNQVAALDAQTIPKENDPLDNDPTKCVHAFVCWLNHHWICIRKVHGFWFDMNSVHSAPQYLSYFRIDLFLGELQRQGYYVYKVTGRIPECDMRMEYPDNETLHGKWLPLITDDRGIPQVLHDESPKQKRRKPVNKTGTRYAIAKKLSDFNLALTDSMRSFRSSEPDDKKVTKTSTENNNPNNNNLSNSNSAQNPPPPNNNNNVSNNGNNLTKSEEEEIQLAIALSLSMDSK